MTTSILGTDLVSASRAVINANFASLSTQSSAPLNSYTVGPTSSGATYITDGVADEVQINQAITAANTAGGGTVFLYPGTYTCAATISMLSNVNLVGSGYSSKITLPGAFSLQAYQKSNILYNNFRIDGTSNTSYCFEVGNSSDVTIDGCWVTNGGNFCAFIYAQPGNTTRRIRVTNNYLQQTNGAQDTLGGGPTATDVTAVFKDVVIDNNFLIKDMTAGGANENAFDMVAVNGLTFTNNTCYGKVSTGTEQDFNYQLKFTNNTVHPAVSASSTFLTVDMKATGTVSEGALVSNNIVDQGYLKINGASSHVTKRCVISNNIIYSTSADNGIWTNQTDAVVITGNVCIGTSTSNRWGILIQSSTNTICNNNYVNGYDNNIFDNAVDVSNMISDNISINFLSAAVVASGSSPNNMGANPETKYAQGNITGATTFNRVNGDVITATLTGNVVSSITAAPGSRQGDRLTLILTEDGTGNRTLAWPSNFKKAGGTLTIASVASAVNTVKMVWDGTNWQEESRSLANS